MKNAVHTMQKIDRVSETFFWSLIATIVISSCVYMYAIHKTVRNVVARGQTQAMIAELNSKLSDTEFEYMNTMGAITLDTAHSLGFISPADKSFVTREKTGQNVAFRQ